jgi:hypothetical protein
MPRGSKSSYSSKQKRQASKIEKSVKKRGGKTKDAERIAWATVNKQTGGAKGKKKKKTAKKTKKKTSKKKTSKKKGRK